MFAPLVAKPKSKSAELQRLTVAAQRPSQAEVTQAHMLQRSIGNQAVLRLLAQRASPAGIEPPHFVPGESNQSRMRSAFGAPPFAGGVQAKLDVGAVNDPLEHEADRVADQVMRMPAPELSIATAPPQVSHKCAECEEEEKLQKKPAGPETATGEAPAIVHEVLRSPGQPLDAATREFFEPRFGLDFSQVRVHTGTSAEQSARDVNAHAYTVGRNMVFDAGRFAPGTQEGRGLLAHELTHVVQQSIADSTKVGLAEERPRQIGRVNASHPFIQCDKADSRAEPSAEELVARHQPELIRGGTDRFAEGLAVELRDYIKTHPSPYAFIREVLDEVGPATEDNVAAALVDELAPQRLEILAATPDGRATLDILYDAMITGDVSPFEREQAGRILKAKMKRIPSEQYVAQIEHPMIFPMQNFPGISQVTSCYAVFRAVIQNRKVHVYYDATEPLRTCQRYRDDVQTLLGGKVTSYLGLGSVGLDLDPDQIVGVRDYDEGETLHTVPALQLIDFANQMERDFRAKFETVVIIGATLGAGGLGGAGVRELAAKVVEGEATKAALWTARALLWADRVAMAVPVVSMVANEHRDWILTSLGIRGGFSWISSTRSTVSWQFMGGRGWVSMDSATSSLH